MRLPFFVARRYLFAGKSHNVINIISAISMLGMAIGTAVLIIVLSVYNGFDGLVRSSLSDLDPDYIITPSAGKTFVAEGADFDWLHANGSVENVFNILQENIFVQYEGRQSVAKAKGVDSLYEAESPLRTHMLLGDFSLHHGEMQQCLVGMNLAGKLGVNVNFLSPMEFYFPSREGSISIQNPMASIGIEHARPTGIFSVNADTDNSLVIVPIELMRDLLDYEKEVSAVEVRLAPGLSRKQVKEFEKDLYGHFLDGFVVRDRMRQNDSLYKMMKYEKAAIFLILVFIIIIIAFNVFGSLSMLIIEKTEDISTFRSMGATEGTVKSIFVLEGWLISLIGLVSGLALGVAFVLLQQKFGFISMPSGSYVVKSYPVRLQLDDLLITGLGVALIGYLIALLPASSLSSRR